MAMPAIWAAFIGVDCVIDEGGGVSDCLVAGAPEGVDVVVVVMWECESVTVVCVIVWVVKVEDCEENEDEYFDGGDRGGEGEIGAGARAGAGAGRGAGGGGGGGGDGEGPRD